MPEFFQALFTSGPFIPHGHCFLWKPALIWLHVISDACITLAYYSIPCLLLFFLRQRRDIPFPTVFGLFCAFIFACGTTHLVSIWTLWYPAYWLSGVIKAGTAGVSLFTALTLVPLMPAAIALPSPKQLEQANQALQREIAERKEAEAYIQQLNAALEQRVQERTEALEQTNHQLRRERDRYESLVLATAQAVWLSAPDGQVLHTSSGWQTLTGQREDEATSNGWLSCIHPDDQAQVAAAWKTAIATSTPYCASYRLKTAQGEYREISARAIPILEPDGHIREWVGTCVDHTERNQLERALKTSQTKLNDILNQANAAIVSFRLFTDFSYYYEYHSSGCVSVFGYSGDEFAADNDLWFTNVHPEDRATITGYVYEHVFIEQPVQIEYRFRHKDGSLRWVSETYRSRREADSNSWVVTTVATDITYLKQTRTALRQSEERFQIIYNQVPIGIALNDSASGHYLRANPRFCDLTGYTEAELLTLTWQDLTHPDDIAEDKQQDQRLLTRQISSYSAEKRYRCKDGAYRWVRISVSAIPSVDSHPTYNVCVVEDIEHRRQAELMIRESEERLRRILQNMPMMFNAFSNNNVAVWNQECERVTGYTQAEIVDNPQAMNLLYPNQNYLQTMLNAWQERGNHYRNWEWDLVCKDGSTRTIAWSNISAEFPIAGWQSWGIGIDVTERKRAEAALRRSEEQLRLTLTFTKIGSWAWDLVSGEMIWNENHFRLLGLDPNDYPPTIACQVWRDRIHPDDVSQVDTAFRQALETHTDCEVEYRVVYPDGSEHWVVDRGRGVYDTNDQPIQMLGILIDISDRKQAELKIRQLNEALEAQNRNLETLVEQRTTELNLSNYQLQAEIQERRKTELALRQSEELFRQIFENVPIGIALAQPGTFQFVTLNPAFCEMLGYQSSELLSAGCPNISHPEDLTKEHHLSEQLLNSEIPGYRITKRYLRKDHKVIWGDLIVRSIRNETGDILYVLGLVDDITERKQAEDALADRTRQLEATNRELESFSYSVSHDLRAPLRHINGFVAALKKQILTTEAAHNPKVLHYLNVIESSGKRMGLLIDGLLTLSRVGRRKLEKQSVSLSDLVEPAIQLTKSSYPNGDRVMFSVQPLPTVMGDAAMLQQVFANLIDNAVKFSRDRNSPCVEIYALADNTIVVKDNGVGFQMDYSDQLFGAFQRLHSSAEFEGTGIGLAIVQRIIHRHNGTIWAESTPGQGTSFYFKLSPSNVEE